MGVVTAKAVGLALIVASASCCDVADTVEVKITQVPTEVVLTPSSQTLVQGEVFQFSAVVKDAMGYVVPGSEVAWSSDDPSIASVDEVGTVKGQDGGTTAIRAFYGEIGGQGTVSVSKAVDLPPSDHIPLFPLEIINIKPAGTGNPAIPPTNRIFRAYPGIEYNIRAAVIGGVYPYTYMLSNAPAGMTINPRTGEISWSNPAASANDIALIVTDATGASVNTTWSITVGTSGFLFVNASYSGTETGSITQPYRSLETLFAVHSNNPTAIVYFREGSYTLPGYDALRELGGRPHNWLAYPGEDALVDFSVRGRGMDASGPVYFDRLVFKNMVNEGIRLVSVYNYHTVRRCVYDGIYATTSENNNNGFLKITASSGEGFNSVIQDNEFKNYTRNTQAIGSIYRSTRLLIENNIVHGASNSGSTDIQSAIAPKSLVKILTVRGNMVVVESGAAIGWYQNSSFYESDQIEICYNFFSAPNSSWQLHQWNPHFNQGRTWYWRNTAVGYANSFRQDRACDDGVGPFSFRDNVLMHAVNGLALQCVDYSNNLAGTLDAGFLDRAGKLQGDYAQHIGRQGWQFPDGLTPIDLVSSSLPR